MTFIRRLKLFGFGFVLGLILVYFIFGQRRCTGNSVLKIQELNFQTYVYSDSFQYAMRYFNLILHCLLNTSIGLKLILNTVRYMPSPLVSTV